MRTVKAWRARVVFIALIVLVTSSGCSGDSEQATGDAKRQTYDEVMADYTATREKLAQDIPSGVTWTARTGFRRDEEFQGTTTGQQAAEYQWQCIWMKEYLDSAASPGARTDSALGRLEKIPTQAGWRTLDSVGQENFTKDMQAAKLGDPSGWQAQYDANCR